MVSIFSGASLVLTTVFGTVSFANAACVAPQLLRGKLTHPNASAYSELGTWFGGQKQYACASEAYRKALTLDPGSSRLSYLLGLSLYSAGNLQEAVLALQESIQIAPEVLKPHLLLGAALDRLQRKTEAEAEWRAALKIDPDSTTALDGLAKHLVDDKKYGEAVGLLHSTAADESLTLDLAQAYVGLKRLDDASKLLTSALEKKHLSLPLANTLAAVYLKQVRYQAAVKLTEKTVRQHPSDFQTQRLYLQALVLAGNTAIARPLAHKLLAQSPHNFDLLYMNGVLERDAGEFEAARGDLQQAVTVEPKTAAPHYELGLTLSQLNDPKGAKEQLEQALELGATEAEVHFELAKILRSLGENSEASDQLKLYQQGLLERNHRALAASKAAQGDKELAGGAASKAVAFYRDALDATPDDAQLNFKLAVALDRIGDIAAERAALEKAIQINPDLAEAQNQLGFLDSRGGNSANAERHFREAVRAAPGFTEAWVNLAATLGLESRFSEADEAVTSALRLEPNNPQALLLRQTLAKAQGQH
jgi:tetratricopeptide (TPR) repeat protein